MLKFTVVQKPVKPTKSKINCCNGKVGGIM